MNNSNQTEAVRDNLSEIEQKIDQLQKDTAALAINRTAPAPERSVSEPHAIEVQESGTEEANVTKPSRMRNAFGRVRGFVRRVTQTIRLPSNPPSRGSSEVAADELIDRSVHDVVAQAMQQMQNAGIVVPQDPNLTASAAMPTPATTPVAAEQEEEEDEANVAMIVNPNNNLE